MPSAVLISGFVDSEVRVATPNGKKVANFRVNDGSTWIGVAAWEELADRIPPQGGHLIVRGRLASRSYDNAAGVKVTVTEVIASSIDQVAGPALPAQNPPADDSIFTD